MKKLLKICYLIFFGFWLKVLPMFYEANINDQKIFLISTHTNDYLLAYDFFIQAALHIQHILEIAIQENRKVILTIPPKYPKKSTIDVHAPYVEGSRVALAWVSAYARFNDLDVTVVRLPAEQNLHSALSAIFLPKQSFEPSLTPEEKFEKSIYHYQQLQQYDSLKDSELKLYDYLPSININEQLIEPQFPQCKEDKKRIVITGGAGFLGSYLTEALLQMGHQVIILDNFSCCKKDNLEKFYSNQNLEIYDIDVSREFTIQGPIDWIIHLASVPSPTDYYSKPHETLRSGLHGTYNCIQLALQKNARLFFSSTSEVYGDPEISPQKESYEGNVHPYGKRSQYDQSKRGAETLIKLYFEAIGLDVRIARIFNTYGPKMRLSDGRVITNFIEAMINNKPFTIYGDGTQTRSFCYVTDLIHGLLKVITAENNLGSVIDDRIYNVGNPQEFSINELAEKANELSKKIFGRVQPINKIENIDRTDPKVRRPDINKISNTFGFNPTIPLQEGLSNMLNAYLTAYKD